MNFKVLLISLDSSILDRSSDAYRRMQEYARLVEGLHVFIFGRRRTTLNLTQNSAENLHLYFFSANFFGWLKALFFGKKLVREKQIDVISAQDPFETGLLGFLISKFSQFHRPNHGTVLKTALNIQLHGDFYGNPYWRVERLLNRLRWHLGLFVLRRATSIRVVSERIRQTLISNFKFQISKFIIVPIFTDVEYFRNAQPKFDLKEKYPQFNFIILTVANLVPVKNLEFLIGAIKKLHEILPNAGLVIVGDGPLQKKLELRIKNLGLENIVILAGAQKDLVSYYKGADCFVLVSKYEGWGRAVVEAAASSIPIVMTDVGLAGEVVKNEESGIVFPGFREDDLVRALSQIHFNQNLREKLIAGAHNVLSTLPSKEQTSDLIKKSWVMANYE